MSALKHVLLIVAVSAITALVTFKVVMFFFDNHAAYCDKWAKAHIQDIPYACYEYFGFK